MAQSKSRKKKSSNPEVPVAPDETPENLDKVRDILFGGQMRAVESRLARIEERLLHEQQALKKDLEKQLASLESFSKKEVSALSEKLGAERSRRADEVKAIGDELNASFKSLDRRLATVDEATSTADAELRTQLLEHSKAMSGQMKTLSDEFSAQLTRAVRELRAEKTDTASLIEVFSDMAVRLSEDLQASTDE
jgi:vacuolar-type H+-ATPase subunit I/STV1